MSEQAHSHWTVHVCERQQEVRPPTVLHNFSYTTIFLSLLPKIEIYWRCIRWKFNRIPIDKKLSNIVHDCRTTHSEIAVMGYLQANLYPIIPPTLVVVTGWWLHSFILTECDESKSVSSQGFAEFNKGDLPNIPPRIASSHCQIMNYTDYHWVIWFSYLNFAMLSCTNLNIKQIYFASVAIVTFAFAALLYDHLEFFALLTLYFCRFDSP